MAGYEGESERMWDEYDWERFLQQQDQKTEKYMQLLETYLDDPQRDKSLLVKWAGPNCWTRRIGAQRSTRCSTRTTNSAWTRQRDPARPLKSIACIAPLLP